MAGSRAPGFEIMRHIISILLQNEAGALTVGIPFTLHVECDFSGGSITVDQQGFGYYWRGGGGKGGGGAGGVYRVSSGTVTMN